MKKNNKGFSLVELIIIIAIMAVLTVAVISYSGMIGDSHARKCAKEIESTLSDTKVCAMSRAEAKMIIYANNNGVYVTTVQTGRGTETKKIGQKGVKVEYCEARNSDAYTQVGTTEATGVVIQFDRASGACKKMDSGNYCYGFKVTAGDSVYKVVIEPLTGKTTVR